MTHATPLLRPAIVGLLLTVALPVTPAFGQDAIAPAPTPVEPAAPPPVTITPPAAPQATATPPSPSSTSTVQPVLRNGVPVNGAPAAESTPQAEAAARPARRTVARERPAPRRRAAAPAAAPAETVAPAAIAAAPAPSVEPAAPPPAAQPVASLPEPAAPPAEPATAEAQNERVALWPFAAMIAATALGLIVFFALRRRRSRREEELEAQHYDYVAAGGVAVDPVTGEPLPEPLMAEPVAPRHDPVPDRAAPAFGAAAGLATGAALHDSEPAEAERPWLEFAMHPRRAGTSADEALVEFELTVDNHGSAPANDVRIATWMFADGQLSQSEMERLLIEPPAGSQMEAVSIEPGASTHIESAIALPKSALAGSVLPVVVADARYRLPDGSEGRTSTSFAVGLPSGNGLEPFAIDQSPEIHEDVEARLEQELQRV